MGYKEIDTYSCVSRHLETKRKVKSFLNSEVLSFTKQIRFCYFFSPQRDRFWGCLPHSCASGHDPHQFSLTNGRKHFPSVYEF